MEIRKIFEQRLEYEGLFRMDELWRLYYRFLDDNGYMNAEQRNEEKLFKDGKFFYIKILPFKKISDYIRFQMDIDLQVKRLVEKTVKVGGHEQKYHYGKVEIDIKGILQTDWRGRYENSGFMFLLRTMTDRFIKRTAFSEAQNQLAEDCARFKNEIRDYLNMHKFKPSEEAEPQEPDDQEHSRLTIVVMRGDDILMVRGHESPTDEDVVWRCLLATMEGDDMGGVVLSALKEQAGISKEHVVRMAYGDGFEVEEDQKRLRIQPVLVEIKEVEFDLQEGMQQSKWIKPSDMEHFRVAESFKLSVEKLPLKNS